MKTIILILALIFSFTSAAIAKERKIIDYKIVYGYGFTTIGSCEDLTSNVMQSIKDGYEPLGSPYSIYSSSYQCQAMVKYKTENKE